MHMQGTPQTMQSDPRYDDVVREVGEFFEERLRVLGESGIHPEAVCLDPGIGFGKTLDHNLELLANLGAFARFGRPVCLGVSRKGFIGQLTGAPGRRADAGIARGRVLRGRARARHRSCAFTMSRRHATPSCCSTRSTGIAAEPIALLQSGRLTTYSGLP